MADPIVEQIAQELESRLRNVTTANGFNQNLIVTRPARYGVIGVKDNLAIIRQSGPVPNADLSNNGIIPGNPPAQEWVQVFTVTLLSRQSERDSTPAETYVNQMWADAKQAITRFDETDQATWDSFGGLAREAEITDSGIGIWEDDVATAAIEINVTVKYRTSLHDPYTGR